MRYSNHLNSQQKHCKNSGGTSRHVQHRTVRTRPDCSRWTSTCSNCACPRSLCWNCACPRSIACSNCAWPRSTRPRSTPWNCACPRSTVHGRRVGRSEHGSSNVLGTNRPHELCMSTIPTSPHSTPARDLRKSIHAPALSLQRASQVVALILSLSHLPKRVRAHPHRPHADPPSSRKRSIIHRRRSRPHRSREEHDHPATRA